MSNDEKMDLDEPWVRCPVIWERFWNESFESDIPEHMKKSVYSNNHSLKVKFVWFYKGFKIGKETALL